jgi:hypothetical protein
MDKFFFFHLSFERRVNARLFLLRHLLDTPDQELKSDRRP